MNKFANTPSLPHGVNTEYREEEPVMLKYAVKGAEAMEQEEIDWLKQIFVELE